MSTSVKSTLDTSPPTDDDLNALGLVFGKCTCKDDWGTLIIWYLGLVILATLLFVVLAIPPTTSYLVKAFGADKIVIVKSVIFFVGILIIDILMRHFRFNNHLCCQDPRDCCH